MSTQSTPPSAASPSSVLATPPSWVHEYPDIAQRLVGGAVIWANNEFFAPREALIAAGKPQFQPGTFSDKGQIYDGWETRRRRSDTLDGLPESDAEDSAIIRLGMPAIVHGCVVDTSWFKGNYPPQIAIDGLYVDETSGQHEVLPVDKLIHHPQWFSLIPPTPICGDSENYVTVPPTCAHIVSHVRLRIIPDGGIARLRVHGQPLIHPLRAAWPLVDAANLQAGARIVDCSNRFYSSPQQILYPGTARSMGEGWETARRRSSGHEWVEIQLAAPVAVQYIGIDTSYFIGNCPGYVQVDAINMADGSQIPLIERKQLQPDTRHIWQIEPKSDAFTNSVEKLKIHIYPDGGLARVHVWGAFTSHGVEQITRMWNTMQSR